jgi:hypothetical protein
MHVAGPLTIAQDCTLIGTFHLVGFDGDLFEDFIKSLAMASRP